MRHSRGSFYFRDPIFIERSRILPLAAETERQVGRPDLSIARYAIRTNSDPIWRAVSGLERPWCESRRDQLEALRLFWCQF
jgi:hypothetical protein